MRYTITHRKGPYWLVAATLVAMLMMALGWAVHRAWNVPAAGNVELLIVFAALLAIAGLTLIFILKLAGSPPWHTTIEAEPHERMLRVESTTVRGASRLAVPFDECVEIRLDTVSRKNYDPLFRLCVVASGGAEHSILEVDRQKEARDVAARLGAEIGCVSTDRPFPLAFKRTLSQAGFTTHVRNDPAARVLWVYRRRGLFGWDSWAYPYDDIAEIVAEPAETGESGGMRAPGGAGIAAERPASYGVRIVPQEGVLRDDVAWNGAGVPDPIRHDTVFRTNDRDEARLTAERLARRIGCPWRDATT